jgi:hypothetical protein
MGFSAVPIGKRCEFALNTNYRIGVSTRTSFDDVSLEDFEQQCRCSCENEPTCAAAHIFHDLRNRAYLCHLLTECGRIINTEREGQSFISP